jgi:hypothetical protein
LLQIELNPRPSFGGHEKFVFRQGWLTKGIEAVRTDPMVFTHDEALVTLGVGKNMVRSIRHWCMATGMVEETDGSGLARPLRVSQLGESLLGVNGWDPYLEDMGTLWLLHWQLVSNYLRGLVWTLTFSVYLAEEFSKRDLIKFISGQFERLDVHTTEGTIEREVDCCLLTYVPSQTKQSANLEETLNCPLNELGLVRFTPEESVYRFNVGPKPTLSANLFGYALLTYLSRFLQNRRTVAVEECVYPVGSPGQVFKLDENSVVEYLEALENQMGGRLRIQETAGLRQIYLQNTAGDALRADALELLKAHYE